MVDAISGMPYPDHYSAQGDYKPWEHPYTTVHNFGESAMARQERDGLSRRGTHMDTVLQRHTGAV